MPRELALAVAVSLAAVGAFAVGAVTTSTGSTRDSAVDRQATLSFSKDGSPVRTASLAELTKTIPAETVTGWDPYYQKQKRFRGLPLTKVLEAGFGAEALATKEFVLRAKDGYAVYFRGSLATEAGGYVAFEDLDVPAWEPIGPQQANPGPFYVVWREPAQAELESHPRPWQLASIEMLRFEAAYPHTSPGALADSDAAMIGYHLFRDRCFKCHAINREGGRVGPELNVPRNILEYRPEEQVRAYIRNPLSFRYGNMPAHPDFNDENLDSLVAYLRAMQSRKHDDTK
jgi:mono/diheme cytochrome c family protein